MRSTCCPRRAGRCAASPSGSRALIARERGIDRGRGPDRPSAPVSCTSTRSTRPRRSKASCAAAMSISTKLPSITRAGPSSFSSPRIDVRVHPVARHQPDLAAERVAAPPGQLLGDDDAARAGQQLQELLRGERVGACRSSPRVASRSATA